MRVLIANTERGVGGGAETYLLDVLPRLRARGHELAVLYEQPAAAGRTAIEAGAPDVPLWPFGDGRLAEGLARALAWRPDVCYLHGLESPAVEAALLDRFPGVLFAHNYHATCVSGTKRHARPAPCPCRRVLGAGCLLAYFPRGCGGLDPRTLLRLYGRARRRRALLPRYRAVVVASRHMRDEYRRHGVADERLHLAPLYPAGARPDPEPPQDRPLTGRVMYAGRLTDVKGTRQLVEALRQAGRALGRPLTLVVAGDGSERAALEGDCRRSGVPAEFHGWLDRARAAALMRGADVLTVSSVWPEPFGLVGLEAGCVGLPAVAHAIGGIPDWLRPGESGELAPGDPPTPAGLAAALVRALADPAHLARLRRGAWGVAGRFTAERHLAILEGVLEGAVRGHLAPDQWGVPAAAGGSQRPYPAAGAGAGAGGG
jgi:glycosyltransferase involved in cell wall biosynthesis